MGACVLDQADGIGAESCRELDFTSRQPWQNSAPGVFVPDSGLTAIQELARLLGLWEADVEEYE